MGVHGFRIILHSYVYDIDKLSMSLNNCCSVCNILYTFIVPKFILKHNLSTLCLYTVMPFNHSTRMHHTWTAFSFFVHSHAPHSPIPFSLPSGFVRLPHSQMTDFDCIKTLLFDCLPHNGED